MHVNQTAEYAIRAMVQIAREHRSDLITARDLAVETNIPRDYLSKILRNLVEHSLLVSRKGHHGGFGLAQPPEAIRFYDVFLAVGLHPDLKHCAFGWDRCDNDRPCPLHRCWSRVNENFWDWSLETNLALCADSDTDEIPLAPPASPNESSASS